MGSSSLIDWKPSPDAPPPQPMVARVLHVINGEHYAGAERVQDLLASQLPSLGFDVAFACLKTGQFPTMRRSQDAPLHDLRMAGRMDLRPVARLTRFLRDEDYQLVHAHTPRTALLAAIASAAARVPMVYHVHSPASRDSTRGMRNRINAQIERLCLRRASAAIAVSRSLARDTIAGGVDPAKVFVVPNGVPGRPVRQPRDAGRLDWTLGTIALFRPRKGTEVLLKALASLRAAGLPVRLLAVGGFETSRHEHELKQTAAEMGVADAVEWTGFTRDVDRELHRMDLFVLPSLFGEGMPMVVLEAMAAGVPVVATHVEGTSEAIRDGLDGLIVEPGNPADLASAVREFIEARVDWSATSHNAVERHAERFSDQAMAHGTAQVYRRVLNLD